MVRESGEKHMLPRDQRCRSRMPEKRDKEAGAGGGVFILPQIAQALRF